MRYSFQKVEVDGFIIYRSQQRAGDTHLKKFSAGVTPQNQGTLNIYLSGSFRLSSGEFLQDFGPGDTSLDTALASYPNGVVFTETVLSQDALRYCVSKLGGGPWCRAKVGILGAASFDTDSVLVVISGSIGDSGLGSIIRIPAGEQVVGDAVVVRCWLSGLNAEVEAVPSW